MQHIKITVFEFQIKEKTEKRMVFDLLAAYAAPAVGGAVGAVGSYLGVPAMLSALGFGTIGVTGGSIAAGVQSSLGAVTAGSWFATLTSAGMTGLTAVPTMIFTAGGAVLGAMFGLPFL